MKPSHMLTRITTTLLLVLLVLPAATARPQGAWAAPALPANPTTACNWSDYMRQRKLP